MKTKNFVVVVNLVENIKWSRMPHAGEYDSPRVKEIIPCTKTNGKFVSWESNQEVNVDEHSLVWPVLVGTMFRLKDGREILLNRKISGEVFFDTETPFNPASMVYREAK